MSDPNVVISTPRATEMLLTRNLVNFGEHNIVGKVRFFVFSIGCSHDHYTYDFLLSFPLITQGMLYKKGHLNASWRRRAWVVNDFASGMAEAVDHRDGVFRYFRPQQSAGYDRDTTKDYIATALGMTNEQKTIRLDTVYFEEGPKSNIKESETIYQDSAYALNVTFVRTEEVSGTSTMEYQFVFESVDSAQDYIRALYQAAKRCPNLLQFIEKSRLDKKVILRSPRLGFDPHYQTSLGCFKCAPNCSWPDCAGWGSYCTCLCCEWYTQGGMIFDLRTRDSMRGHLAAPVYAQCCVMEAPVCQCRMVKTLICKHEMQVCCIDLRCALPTDDDVPFQLGNRSYIAINIICFC